MTNRRLVIPSLGDSLLSLAFVKWDKRRLSGSGQLQFQSEGGRRISGKHSTSVSSSNLLVTHLDPTKSLAPASPWLVSSLKAQAVQHNRRWWSPSTVSLCWFRISSMNPSRRCRPPQPTSHRARDICRASCPSQSSSTAGNPSALGNLFDISVRIWTNWCGHTKSPHFVPADRPWRWEEMRVDAAWTQASCFLRPTRWNILSPTLLHLSSFADEFPRKFCGAQRKAPRLSLP